MPGCLAACAWCDDVVVFDSESEDATREIAVAANARVVQRRFDDYAAQRNAALTEVRYRHPWVLMVDADERTPGDLVSEMASAVRAAAPDIAIFRMRRKDFFLGHWLRRSSGYPTWFGRLIRVGRVRVERAVNEEYVTDGGVGYLRGHLEHYPFNRGIAYWIERHNRYSTFEAAAKSAQHAEPMHFKALFARDPVERRRALKRLAYRMPLRPTLVFVYWYVVRLGFLDGRAGFAFSRMRAAYELMIDLKAMECERIGRGEPV